MRAIAPDEDWRWIRQASDRLRSRAVSVPNKRARLQSPEQLVALGRRLMESASAAPELLPIEQAKLYRDGLIIAFLAYSAH